MSDPKICVYVQKDILQPLKWMIKEFNKELKIVSFNSPENFESALSSEDWDMLILDSTLSQESVKNYLEKIKDKKPELKTTQIPI